MPLLAADVCAEVGAELLQAGARAQETSIEPWRMLLDPGLGFAKTQASNLTLLRHLLDVRRALVAPGALRRAPLLLGPSRKGFLGRITGACCAGSCGVCCTVGASRNCVSPPQAKKPASAIGPPQPRLRHA